MAPFKEFLLLRIPVGERERALNLKKIAGGLAFSFRLYSKKKIGGRLQPGQFDLTKIRQILLSLFFFSKGERGGVFF